MLASPARADEESDEKQLPTWEVGVGGSAFAQPDYVGSDEYRIRGIGFPWIIYRGERWKLTREAIQGRIFRTERVRLDLSVYGQLPVDSGKNDRRDGMPDLDWRAQVGPNLRFLLATSDDGRDTLRLDLPVRAVFAVDIDEFSYQGYTSSPKLRYRIRRGPWNFETQLGVEFNDSDYNDYIYSVDSPYVTPTRAAYNADGGFAGTRVAAGLNRYLGKFYVGLFVRYINLEGATFHDSPLVGTRHAVTGGLALAWIPLTSDSNANVDSNDADLED
jgi:outer membrane scaffolding protein for murein synthesis (MipA/OmpV family)